MATAYVNPQQGLGEKAGTSRCPNACVCHLQADRGKPYRRELTQSVDGRPPTPQCGQRRPQESRQGKTRLMR